MDQAAAVHALHQGRTFFSPELVMKYASGPLIYCVGSYQKNSNLCHFFGQRGVEFTKKLARICSSKSATIARPSCSGK
jgi:hypothetical protein